MPDLLSRLAALPRKIRVGVIGIGNIGRGIVYQVDATPGMECVAVADIRPDRAATWAARLGLNYQVVDTSAELQDTLRRGVLAVCADGLLIAGCEEIDVLVDASSSIGGGARFALAAIAAHKHVVMMNSESDLIFGPYLLQQAKESGVVYTSADGDQHTVLKRLMNDTELWGFKTVLAGNMKGFQDRYADPTKIIPEAAKRFMDARMCASYTDGTKLGVEMALTANAIGGKVITPGMRGPRMKDVYGVFEHFDFEKVWDGDIPLVDYVLGAQPSGGVFVVGFNDHPHQVETLSWYPCYLGPGPFYVFHRPYHLGHIESVASIAEAYLDGWAVLQPTHGFRTNVYAYAKRDLRHGEELDGIGGYAAYGLIENVSENQLRPGLPICLADHVSLKRDIRQDEKIFWEDVTISPDEPAFRLFELAQQASAAVRPREAPSLA
ncbi:MAG: hypothetical protein WCF12_04395 [Propionicimonas sp.]